MTILKILKPKEVCELLHISIRTLQRWDNNDRLKAFRNPCNRRFYTEEQINDFIKRCKK